MKKLTPRQRAVKKLSVEGAGAILVLEAQVRKMAPVYRAAMRWHKTHELPFVACRCPECTLFKACARAAKGGKRGS
jgi:hypothetical protein